VVTVEGVAVALAQVQVALGGQMHSVAAAEDGLPAPKARIETKKRDNISAPETRAEFKQPHHLRTVLADYYRFHCLRARSAPDPKIRVVKIGLLWHL